MNLAEGEHSVHLFFMLQAVDEFAVVAAWVISGVGADDLGPLYLGDDAVFLLQ